MADVEVGDVFNETDDDKMQLVVEVHGDRDPPVALCRSMKREEEETETEEEYALDYVRKCVKFRKEFIKKDYDKKDVRAIYLMSTKELRQALKLGNQSIAGGKERLRKRLMGYLNICEVPSDVASGTDGDEEEDRLCCPR